MSFSAKPVYFLFIVISSTLVLSLFELICGFMWYYFCLCLRWPTLCLYLFVRMVFSYCYCAPTCNALCIQKVVRCLLYFSSYL